MDGRKALRVFCDGGARGNPGPGAAGYAIEVPAENVRYLCGKYLGVVTNNQAEYAAVKLALEKIRDKIQGKAPITFFLDSLLVVNQLNGFFRVKNPVLAESVLKIRSLEGSLGLVSYKHVVREKNKLADSLVNRVLDEKRDFDTQERL